MRRCLAMAAAILWLAGNAAAQGQFGQITGLVTDQTGAGVPGASVTVRNEKTGVEFKTVSNTDGNYIVTSLVPGTYSVATSKAGFQSVTHTGISLNLAQTARIDISLTLGEVQQHVQVEAAGVLLQTETASVGSVMPQSEVIDLPLNGRNYLQLATLIPGTTSAGIGNQFFGMPQNNLNVNGMRSSSSMYMIDGADVMEQFNSGTEYTPAPDAIQEFRVETNNMAAQYGGGGAILNVALKSGTNSFHGDVYEFLRNDKMDARNFFALSKPELRRNQFGGVLGGPIKKDKLFFFLDYQGIRIRSGVTSNSVVPAAAHSEQPDSGLADVAANAVFPEFLPARQHGRGHLRAVGHLAERQPPIRHAGGLPGELFGPGDLHAQHAEGRCVQSGSVPRQRSHVRTEPGRIHQPGLDAHVRADAGKPGARLLRALFGFPDRTGHRHQLHGAGGHPGI